LELNLIQKIAVFALPVIFAITLHEAAHGYAALRFGDRTAQMMGRISLNPLRHIDLMGTIIVPAITIVLGGILFGWAKPVPVNYHRLRQPKRDMALVALAGPSANLVMALGWALVLRLAYQAQTTLTWLGEPLLAMGVVGVNVNVMLGVLNLVPIPPLDGSRVLAGVLPDRFGLAMARMEPYGLIVLVLLLASGTLNLMPIVNGIRHFILTLFFF